MLINKFYYRQKSSELDDESEDALSHLFTFVKGLFELSKQEIPLDSDVEMDLMD